MLSTILLTSTLTTGLQVLFHQIPFHLTLLQAQKMISTTLLTSTLMMNTPRLIMTFLLIPTSATNRMKICRPGAILWNSTLLTLKLDISTIPSLMVSIFTYTQLALAALIITVSGKICDENGEFIPPDTPPTSDPNLTPQDWNPYKNRLQFELADFLYRRNQMSAGDINSILGLWAASLTVHNDEPPFSNAKDLYSTIDSTLLGDVAWQSFSLQYNGIRPTCDVPPWMLAEYDVWFRDPLTLVRNILSNPDLKDFDYAPFQEYSADGTHRFKDFMSGIWAWQQAVSFRFFLTD